MKFKIRIFALLLALVMLLPMVVACGDVAVENTPVADKTPEAGELTQVPDEIAKTDAKALLLELLKSSRQDVSMADVSIKFKGDITVSFLEPKISYNTNSFPHLDENGFAGIDAYMLFETLEEMLNEKVSNIGDFDAGFQQLLFDMLLGAEGQEGFDAVMTEVFNSISFEGLSADYGSSENYVTALLVSRLVAAACILAEKEAHAGEEIPDDCISYIEDNVSYTMTVVENVLDTADSEGEKLEAIIAEIYEGGYISYLSYGCINGYDNGYTEYLDTAQALASIIENVYYFIEYEGDYYAEGDNTLYYDAIKDELYTLVYIGMATYVEENDVFNYGMQEVFVEPIVEALDTYLASAEGPIMQGDFAKALLAISAASVASATSIEVFIDLGLENAISDVEYAYFNLNTEKWYDVNGEEIDVSDFIKLTNTPVGYANAVGGAPEAYDYVAGAANVYSVYEITLDEIYVDVNTFVEMSEKTFDLYLNALENAEITEQNAMLYGSIALTYVLSLPQQDSEYNPVIDTEFAIKYILAIIGFVDNEATVEGLTEIVALFTNDEDMQAEILEYLLAAYVPERESADDLNELYIIINILENMDTDKAYNRFDYGNFYWEISLHLYNKYLANTDGVIYDGVPVYVAAGFLYAYANEKLDIDLDCEIIYNYYFDGYYKGDNDNSTYAGEPLVYYEDLVAMALMLQTYGDLEMLYTYDYPFDFVEHQAATLAVMGVLQARAVNDENTDVLDIEMNVMLALLDDIFTNNAPAGDRFAIVGQAMLVAFNALRTENDALIDVVQEYVDMYLCDKYQDVDYNGQDYDIDFAFAMFVSSLLDAPDPDAPDYTVLAYIIDLANGTDNPEYNAALVTAITDAIMGVDVTDPAAMGELLAALDTVIGVPGLGSVADAFLAIVPEDGDNTVELMLDALILEIFGESDLDYTVLTDVILALMGGDANEVATAIDTAITALMGDADQEIKGDYLVIGYLRALGGYAMSADAYANVFTLSYVASDLGDYTILAAVPAALYMSYDEFMLYFEFAHNPNYDNVRAWAEQYVNAFMTDAKSVNVVEAAVDFLVASGYYADGEIPAETDENYYEKLTAIYVAESVLGNEDWAEAVVAVMFDRAKLPEYAEVFLGMANAYSEGDNVYLTAGLYVLQTVAHLERDDFYEIDWEEVLAYVPTLVYGMTGEELEIANYTALAEMLKKSYDGELAIDVAVECVPYDNVSATTYVFTVKGSIVNKAVNGSFEAIITYVVPKA